MKFEIVNSLTALFPTLRVVNFPHSRAVREMTFSSPIFPHVISCTAQKCVKLTTLLNGKLFFKTKFKTRLKMDHST